MLNIRKRYQESIQVKFLSVIFFIMLVTTLAASALIAQNERAQMKQSLLDKGQSLGAYIAYGCV